MIHKISRIILIGFLSGQLILVGCVSTATIQQASYAPFVRNQPVSDQELEDIKAKSPKDAVFADLLQAFSLLRTGDIANSLTRKKILGLLESSVFSFEDMSDPINFSLAFSADESKPFRGRPHERMFASAITGVLKLAENLCGEALPYLKNAEWLDARFNAQPFGTDAPLIYALMYRCLAQIKASQADINRAGDGVFRSVRFLTLQEPMISALVGLSDVDLRPMAIANRLAYMIYEISIYHSLMTAPNHFDIDLLLDDAAKNVALFIPALGTHFQEEYKARMKPLITELAKVYDLSKKSGEEYLENLVFDHVLVDAKAISQKLKKVFAEGSYKKDIRHAQAKTNELTEKILVAARSDKMMLNFVGRGPALVREGSYDEISVIKPGPEASLLPQIRQKSFKIDTSCGFHRTDSDGGFAVVLCRPGLERLSGPVEMMPTYELLSLSRKAMTTQGREFEKILRGRAQFRAATETVAEVTAWSAFFLFYLGAEMMSDCQRRGESQACYTKGLVLWTIAGVTVVFSGTIWLLGKTKNPAADSRYIHSMYESVYLAI